MTTMALLQPRKEDEEALLGAEAAPGRDVGDFDDDDAEVLVRPTPPLQRLRLADWWRAGVVSLVALSLPLLLPAAHMRTLHWFWARFNLTVDRESCACSCWDTVFKGPYEIEATRYKNVYFNATVATFHMWVATVLLVVALYEATRHVIKLYMADHLRRPIAVLLAFCILPNYTFWWTVWNAWNDDYYHKWAHLVVYGLSQMVATAVALHLADSHHPVTYLKALALIVGAIVQLSSGFIDEIFDIFIQGTGYIHTALRDLFLVISAAVMIAFGLWYLRKSLIRCDAVLWRTAFLISCAMGAAYLLTVLL